MLDECTTSLGKKSAAQLQQVIYDSFSGTVINIAHHLDFVRDAQKLLCLNAGGTVADYDTPSRLSANPNSLFSMLQSSEANSQKAHNPQQPST